MGRFRRDMLPAIVPVLILSTGLRTQWDLGGLSVFAAAGLRPDAPVVGRLRTEALIVIVFADLLADGRMITTPILTTLDLRVVAWTMPPTGGDAPGSTIMAGLTTWSFWSGCLRGRRRDRVDRF